MVIRPQVVAAPPVVVLHAPTPVVTAALAYHYRRFTARATTLDRLMIKAPAGTSVTATCPKGCARKRVTVARAAGTVSLKALFKRPLKAKTVITRPGAVAAVKVLTVRAGKPPAISSLCLPPGTAKPTSCATLADDDPR